MREIKFRLWSNGLKVMYTPDNEIGGLWSIPMAPNGVIKPTYKDDILMQFTGRKDKNGKEIYEGDIVKQRSEGTFINYGADEETFDVDKIYTGEIVIIASKGVCMRNPKYIDMIVDTTKEHKSNQYINVVQYRCEIIGNIYEDSHLLE